MTEKPTVKSAEPESPRHSPESNPPPAARSAWPVQVPASLRAAAPRRRPWWKKIPVPIALAVLGVGLVAAAYFLYPHRASVVGVTGASVSITGSSDWVNDHMDEIFYSVWQVRPDVAHVQVLIQLLGTRHNNNLGIYAHPYLRAHAEIDFSAGAPVVGCSPRCRATPESPSTARPHFYFQGFSPQGISLGPTATANFYVRARRYEVAANGAAATVGFPELDSTGSRRANLSLTYGNFPSASSYDWSSSPAASISHALGAIWHETVLTSNPRLGGGSLAASARVATGVNPTAQQRDSNFALAAGVLFGIGGSALIAAVQEALRD